MSKGQFNFRRKNCAVLWYDVNNTWGQNFYVTSSPQLSFRTLPYSTEHCVPQKSPFTRSCRQRRAKKKSHTFSGHVRRWGDGIIPVSVAGAAVKKSVLFYKTRRKAGITTKYEYLTQTTDWYSTHAVLFFKGTKYGR